MKPVMTEAGVVQPHVWRTDDGALVVRDDRALKSHIAQTARENALNTELMQLRSQIQMILEKING